MLRRSNRSNDLLITLFCIISITFNPIILILLKVVKLIHLLLVKGFFWPVPYLAFPLYRNSRTGNGTETRHTIFAGDVNIIYNSLLKIVYYFFSPSHPLSGFGTVLSKYNSYKYQVHLSRGSFFDKQSFVCSTFLQSNFTLKN
jgi:hypothetical protein